MSVPPDGTIWALGDDALWRYDGDWSQVSVGGWGWTPAFAVSPEGGVWVVQDGEIIRIEDGTGVTTAVVSWSDALGLEDEFGWPGGFVRLLAPAADGSVWALAEVWGPWVDEEGRYE